MTKPSKIATIFGGTGFVGRQIVRELAKRGVTVKVASRIPESAYFLKPHGTVGQVVPIKCDYTEESIKSAIEGSDYVVNCVGILFQRGKKRSFQKIHVDLPTLIAKACKKAKTDRFVHISALGVDQCTSKYAKTKLEGEKAAKKNFKNVTILRPSVIFGEDDNFFNMFAHLARFSPALPLIGGGHTKFQPVFVGDVADATIVALERAAIGDENPQGKIYELGGPEVVDFKKIYKILFKYTGRKRALVSLPFFAAKIQATFLSLLPSPLLTPDQVESLKHDTIVSKKALKLKDLGIAPTSMDLILPTYLKSYKAGGRFADSKYA